MTSNSAPIWLYDGVCVLCSGGVRYTLRHEREHDIPLADIAAALAVQSRDGENFLLSPEVGGMFSNNTGYNSAAAGSAAHMSEAGRAAFEFAYPGDAIANLWWWPIQESWYITKRNEYQDRFLSA